MERRENIRVKPKERGPEKHHYFYVA
jgi:hypothetical protein